MSSDTTKELADRVRLLEENLREKDTRIKDLTGLALRLQGRLSSMESSLFWTVYQRLVSLESRVLLDSDEVAFCVGRRILENLGAHVFPEVDAPPMFLSRVI